MTAWDNRTAVINLLFYANLLDDTNRLTYLRQGVTNTSDTYVKLAAIVGIQSIQHKNLAPEDKHELKSHLMQEMLSGDGVLAARASISIQKLLTPEDSAALMSLLNRPDKILWHNGLVGLVKVMGERQTLDIIYKAAKAGTIGEAGRQYAEDCFMELANLRESGLPPAHALIMSRLGVTKMAFIPDELS